MGSLFKSIGRGSVQFSSVQFTQSCPTLCDPMDCSTPGFRVHHHLPEFAQTHAHRVGDAIQPSHPLWGVGRRTLRYFLSVKFICYQDHRHERPSEILFHPQRFGKELPTGLVWISWESCLSGVCFGSRKSLLLGHQMICGPVSVWYFLEGCHMNLWIYSLAFGDPRIGQHHLTQHHLTLLIFPIRLKRILRQSSSPVDKISRFQGVMLKGPFLPRSPCKNLLYQNMAVLNRSK